MGYKNIKCCLGSRYINNPVSFFYYENTKFFIWTILVKRGKNTILNGLLWFSWACGNNWFRHRLQYAGMILKLILHVLELDCGHARQYAGTELSKSWALFYMCWCWTVALQSFRSPSVAIKARVCPATCYCSLLSFHRKATGSQPPSHTSVWLGALQSPGRSHQPSSKASLLPWPAFCSASHFLYHYNPSYRVPHQWQEISTSRTDVPSDSVN